MFGGSYAGVLLVNFVFCCGSCQVGSCLERFRLELSRQEITWLAFVVSMLFFYTHSYHSSHKTVVTRQRVLALLSAG